MACCQHIWMMLIGEEQIHFKIFIHLKKCLKLTKKVVQCLNILVCLPRQKENCKTIDKNDYSKPLDPIVLSKERLRQKSNPFAQEKLKKSRIFSEQINWVANQRRPFVLYEYCELAGWLKNATAADVSKANKIV